MGIRFVQIKHKKIYTPHIDPWYTSVPSSLFHPSCAERIPDWAIPTASRVLSARGITHHRYTWKKNRTRLLLLLLLRMTSSIHTWTPAMKNNGGSTIDIDDTPNKCKNYDLCGNTDEGSRKQGRCIKCDITFGNTSLKKTKGMCGICMDFEEHSECYQFMKCNHSVCK